MRVIAGRLGGRTLVAPAGAATRPTADRVREALFSILGDIEGARVLDLFAGTGALGIEALSRGASRATFVEAKGTALRALRTNIGALGLANQATVLPLRVERALSTASWGEGAFDLIFMDPPYADVRAGAFAAPLEKALNLGLAPSLDGSGRLVLEHGSPSPAPKVVGLELSSTRTYGDTSLSFYLR
ncbi:MAG TPA: 16S rRNA (guanine(966)-N(2))-methyltransferase RsmD [Polyangiaceae bacterium]|nr:16S rRNA (guanine(966)-N(2))-methyltransferase RsmD [Polyangiaceae bacterium]